MKQIALCALICISVFLQDVTTLETKDGTPSPKSMSMVSDEQMMTVPDTIPDPTDIPKGKALNFTVNEQNIQDVLATNSSLSKSFDDLSDVSLDNDTDDEHDHLENAKILGSKLLDSHQHALFGICEKDGLTYENGEKLEVGCDSVCTCMNGRMDCVDRCLGPLFKKDKRVKDPLCMAQESHDPCCSVMVCSSDTETEPLEVCSYNNHTFNRGEIYNNGCEEVCFCEAGGHTSCKARCPKHPKLSDRCIEVQDPDDECCKKIICDVTLDEYEQEKSEHQRPRLISAKYLNTTTLAVHLNEPADGNVSLELSSDGDRWRRYSIPSDGLIHVVPDAQYARLEGDTETLSVQNATVDVCEYKGKTFEIGEEYNDHCMYLCVCESTGMNCLKLECPTYFGVDVLDPTCIDWEIVPPNFVPEPPRCCPEKLECKNNGSCVYQGKSYQNWQQLPLNVTGCDKQCYCEMGSVECQNICPAVTAHPPTDMMCPPNHRPAIDHLPDDDCCMYWVCKAMEVIHNGNFGPGLPSYPSPHDEIVVNVLEAVDAHTIKLAFVVPPVMVGLHGRVEVRYTDKENLPQSEWQLQVFAPPDDLISTPQLEFELLGLDPDTEYRLQIAVILQNLNNKSTSRVYKIRTPELAAATLPFEAQLRVETSNATSATIVWRPPTESEARYVDGVQLRYREAGGPVYDATPLLHRSVATHTLTDLRPATEYEVGIVFVPFPGQRTELRSEETLRFTTPNATDPYGFEVRLAAGAIKATSVEVTWTGVPYPEDKYVNVYRAVYQTAAGKEAHSTFKLAKREQQPKTIIVDLKPETKYRLWLEVYLTNGKTKMSNVLEFATKPRIALANLSRKDLLAAKELDSKGDYYGPLVVVSILAAIAIMTTLLLLLILLRKHNQNKAPITTPTRISQSAYDNPTYKVEIQQETMGL